MNISHITTQTSRFNGNEIIPAFRDMVKTKQPFTVWIEYVNNCVPIPFVNGKCESRLVEQSTKSLLTKVLGDVEYAY